MHEGHRPSLPATDLPIAEAAARFVSSARTTSENTAPKAESEAGDAEKPGPESVPEDADPSGDVREINSPPAHANGPDGDGQSALAQGAQYRFGVGGGVRPPARPVRSD
ncbi:hypothetical protein [Streptomyces sp. NRRL S-646]|uniref:hypothetical protein n=1 Tax=Streptomyces sp. NRRL S-646 TaxID=1463917 RepID=UPI000A5A44B2|nr:hypothetical protein [Streptomyces sp. NRRL S-646]